VITLTKETLDDATVVRCGGRLVAGTMEVLHAEIKRLIVPSCRVVLDFSGLTQMDSMGQRRRAVCFSQKRGRPARADESGAQDPPVFSMTNLLSLFESAGDGTTRLP
jgi:hypothetical protein